MKFESLASNIIQIEMIFEIKVKNKKQFIFWISYFNSEYHFSETAWNGSSNKNTSQKVPPILANLTVQHLNEKSQKEKDS